MKHREYRKKKINICQCNETDDKEHERLKHMEQRSFNTSDIPKGKGIH